MHSRARERTCAQVGPELARLNGKDALDGGVPATTG
jgi:hypothetical protein